MAGIADIMWETMRMHYLKSVNVLCSEYENNPEYKVRKFYDGEKLTGFCVYRDFPEYRLLCEAHYVGGSPYVALKMWKWLSKDAKTMRLNVPKTNVQLWQVYQRMGFRVIKEDNINYLMERGG